MEDPLASAALLHWLGPSTLVEQRAGEGLGLGLGLGLGHVLVCGPKIRVSA
jgi:hypothetical protein